MADRGPVKIREGRIDLLLNLYKKSYENLTREIITASEAGKIQRAKVLVRLKVELEDLGVDVDKWVRDEIPKYYNDGANVALNDLRRLGVDLSQSSGAAFNREAIKALTDETALAFADGIRGVSRSAIRFVDDVLKMQLNMIIAEGKLTGETRKMISSTVKQRLQDSGLPAIRDRAGKRWSLDNYSEMLVRTKAVEARNQGLANKMLQYGYDLVQISNHGTDHKECARWEGKILSVTGQTPGYPTLAEAQAAGLFHPRCEHAMNVINLDLAKKTEAYDNPYNYRNK